MRTTLVFIVLWLAGSLGNAYGQNSFKHEHQGAKYFPSRAFAYGPEDRNPDFQSDWFADQLEDLNEPSLMEHEPHESATYRFLLLPTFNHPVSIRVTIHTDGTAKVIVRIGKGDGGYPPDGLLSEHTRELTKAEVTQLLARIQEEQFWTQSTRPPPSGLVTLDGTEWIMEGNSDHYHVVARLPSGSLHKLGLYMLEEIGKVGTEDKLTRPRGVTK